MSAAWGIAGWLTGPDTASDYGDASNDGNNLCRVTLVRGRDPSLPLDQSAQQGAQGQQLLCLVADGVRFPAPGDRVMVIMPEDHWAMPGGSLVVATVTSNPAATGALNDGEQVIFQSPLTGSKIIHRKDGAIVIITTLDGKPGGPMSSLRLGGLIGNTGLPQSTLKFQSGYGGIVFDTSGARIRDGFGNSVIMGGVGFPSPFSVLGNYISVNSALVSIDGANVNLGSSAAGVYQCAVWGASPAGTPVPILLGGITSISVKIGI